MALGNNYAVKYSSLVDEAFSLASLTQSIVNNDYDWVGVQTVEVYDIPTVSLSNYTMSGTARFGTPSELQNDVQALTISQDKAFAFTIDRKQADDTMMAMNAGRALAREVEQVIVPTIDKYRIAALVAAATNVPTAAAITSSNAFAEFLKVQEMLDEDLVPAQGRICLASPAFINAIKQDSSFTCRGDLAQTNLITGQYGEIDGVPVLKAPSSYLTSTVDFIITHPAAMVSPVKLEEYTTFDNPPGISGYLVQGRIRYDAFVLKKKVDAVGVHKNA